MTPPPTRLLRSQVILRRFAEGVYGTDFGDEGADLLFRLDLDRYADMGCPETITVTIEPGDRIQ